MSFINKPDSSSDLTILIISPVSSFKIVSVGKPDPNIFLWIAASVAAAAAVNPNAIKTFLVSTFKTIQFLIMVLKVYLKILLIVLFYVTEFLIILY